MRVTRAGNRTALRPRGEPRRRRAPRRSRPRVRFARGGGTPPCVDAVDAKRLLAKDVVVRPRKRAIVDGLTDVRGALTLAVVVGAVGEGADVRDAPGFRPGVGGVERRDLDEIKRREPPLREAGAIEVRRDVHLVHRDGGVQDVTVAEGEVHEPEVRLRDVQVRGGDRRPRQRRARLRRVVPRAVELQDRVRAGVERRRVRPALLVVSTGEVCGRLQRQVRGLDDGEVRHAAGLRVDRFEEIVKGQRGGPERRAKARLQRGVAR